MELFVATLPIILLITSIVFFKKSIIFSGTIALLSLIFGGLWWGLSGLDMYSAALRGAFVATEIITIVFAALLIVEVIKRRHLFEPIQRLFQRISPDYRVQAVLLAFVLVYFIEGVAGFGTPAIIVVPLLMTLGFKPLHAVILALVGDTIPVSFGAVGLPITFGVDSVLEGLTSEHAAITLDTIRTVGLLNILLSTVLAVLIGIMAVVLRKGSAKEAIEIVPFALLSGLVVSGIAYVTAIYIGAELPSILGGLIGLIVLLFFAKKRIFTPRQDVKMSQEKLIPAEERALIWKSLYPYLLLIGLLIVTRIPFFNIGEPLRSLSVGTDALLGSSIAYSISPLYSAATLLMIAALTTLALAQKDIRSFKEPLLVTIKKVERPYIALLIVLGFVQIFIYSDAGGTLSSMPMVIAQSISEWSGSLWPFVVPFVGALGSFLAGSATVSNLIFSGIQYDIALMLELPPATLLSLQSIGAASGNMIALHNIIAALAIAGIAEANTHKVIRSNVKPLLVLLVIAGMAGLYMSL